MSLLCVLLSVNKKYGKRSQRKKTKQNRELCEVWRSGQKYFAKTTNSINGMSLKREKKQKESTQLTL